MFPPPPRTSAIVAAASHRVAAHLARTAESNASGGERLPGPLPEKSSVLIEPLCVCWCPRPAGDRVDLPSSSAYAGASRLGREKTRCQWHSESASPFDAAGPSPSAAALLLVHTSRVARARQVRRAEAEVRLILSRQRGNIVVGRKGAFSS